MDAGEHTDPDGALHSGCAVFSQMAVRFGILLAMGRMVEALLGGVGIVERT